MCEGETYHADVIHCSPSVMHHVVEVFAFAEETELFAEGEFAARVGRSVTAAVQCGDVTLT